MEQTQSFIDLLAQSRLLSPEQMQTVSQRLQHAAMLPPETVAAALVDEGLLTSYQAERLLEGRSRGFFVDRYRILEILGSGGVGHVFLARDETTGRQVALKVLYDRHQVDAGMLARLRIEAKAAERLKSPYSIRLLDSGDTGAVHYIVLEVIEGINLLEAVALYGPLPWPQACDIIGQTAAGLEFAHRAGIIHRDVKPENILIDRSGRVKILDFGLSMLSGDEEAEFSLQMLFGHDCLGTADYISPEQSLNSRAVDGRTDIYSLGGTFFFALAGRPPFAHLTTPREKIQAHRKQNPPSITQFRKDIPPEVVAVLKRMLAKRADDRFAKAADVAAALQRFARRRPLEFDFRDILARRAAEARMRRQRMHGSRGSTTTASVSGTAVAQPRSQPSPPKTVAPQDSSAEANTPDEDSSRTQL